MKSIQQDLSLDPPKITKGGSSSAVEAPSMKNKQYQHEEISSSNDHSSAESLDAQNNNNMAQGRQIDPEGHNKKRRGRWSQSLSPESTLPSSVTPFGVISCPELDPNADDADFTPSQGIHNIGFSPQISMVRNNGSSGKFGDISNGLSILKLKETSPLIGNQDSPLYQSQSETSMIQGGIVESMNLATSQHPASPALEIGGDSTFMYRTDPPRSRGIVNNGHSSVTITPQVATSRSPSPLVLEIKHHNTHNVQQTEMSDLNETQVVGPQGTAATFDIGGAHVNADHDTHGNPSRYLSSSSLTKRDQSVAPPSSEIELLEAFAGTQKRPAPLYHYGQVNYGSGSSRQQPQVHLRQEYSHLAGPSSSSSQSKNVSSNQASINNEYFQGLHSQPHSERFIEDHSSTNIYSEQLLSHSMGLTMPINSSLVTSGYSFGQGLLFTGTSHGASSRHDAELFDSTMRHGSLFASVLNRGNSFQPQRQDRKSASNSSAIKLPIPDGSYDERNADPHSTLSGFTGLTQTQSSELVQQFERQESQNHDPDPKCCDNCRTTSTPSWRRCPQGRILLCNACGLYHKLHGRPRPFYKTKDGTVKIHRTVSEHQPCTVCGTRTASIWRKGESNEILCNSCSVASKQYQGLIDTNAAVPSLAALASSDSGEIWSRENSGSISTLDSRRSLNESQSVSFTTNQPASNPQSGHKRRRSSKPSVGSRANSQSVEQSQPWLPVTNMNNIPPIMHPPASLGIGNDPWSYLLSAIQEQPASSNPSGSQLEISTSWQYDETKTVHSRSATTLGSNYPQNLSEQQPQLQHWTRDQGVAVSPSANTVSSSGISDPLLPQQLSRTPEVLGSPNNQYQQYRQQAVIPMAMVTMGPSHASSAQATSTIVNTNSQYHTDQQRYYRRYSQSPINPPYQLYQSYQYYQPNKLYQHELQQHQLPSYRQSPVKGFQQQPSYSQSQHRSHRDQYQSRYHHPVILPPQQMDHQGYFQEFTNSNYDITFQTNDVESEGTSQPSALATLIEVPSDIYNEELYPNTTTDKPLPPTNPTRRSEPEGFSNKDSPSVDDTKVNQDYGMTQVQCDGLQNDHFNELDRPSESVPSDLIEIDTKLNPRKFDHTREYDNGNNDSDSDNSDGNVIQQEASELHLEETERPESSDATITKSGTTVTALRRSERRRATSRQLD
ncbi:hypothetical protein BGX27_004884 [Mortierella sp. AM989]|nr:hypothetical protein BGX27_004884 [Mortierella sp. AM989]